MTSSADSDQVAFFRSQLSWIDTVCNGRVRPGSVGNSRYISAHFYTIFTLRLLNIALDKALFSTKKYLYFSYFSTKTQHSHSHFDLGVHVPLGFSIWGYGSLFEGTHILG